MREWEKGRVGERSEVTFIEKALHPLTHSPVHPFSRSRRSLAQPVLQHHLRPEIVQLQIPDRGVQQRLLRDHADELA